MASGPHCGTFRLVLLPRTMDARRLQCLVVHQRRAATVEISGRDALVLALQLRLCSEVDGGLQVCAHDLELFLARRGDTQWLTSGDADALALAFDGDTSEGTTAATQFLTGHNFMRPHARLHDFFPSQPSLYEGASSVVHVLVRVTAPHRQQQPVQPLQRWIPQAAEGWTARLVASMRMARLDRVLNGAKPSPSVVRTRKPGGILWLGSGDSPNACASLYLPASWRLLFTEIFKWLLGEGDDDDDDDDYAAERNAVGPWAVEKGRRVIVTGAPRVGKSAFLGFVLLQLLRLDQRHACIVDVPGFTFALVDLDRNVLCEGTRGVDFWVELRDADAFYLFDGSASEAVSLLRPRDVYAKSILLLPQRFVGKSTRRTESFVMPLWTQRDVRLCARYCFPCLPVESAIDLYYKWGGVPGRVFASDATASEAQLEAALVQINARRVKRALSCVAQTDAWDGIADSGDGDAWAPLVVLVGDGDARFCHEGRVAFTSQFVCDRVLATTAMRVRSVRALHAPGMERLWTQIRESLAYLAQEEEEKHESSTPAAPPAGWRFPF